MYLPWEPVDPGGPSPTATPNPFAPDVTIWPEAPAWLFPTVMTAMGIAGMVVVVLLFMWRKSITIQRAEREAQPKQEWIDLSKLEKGGRWADEESEDPRSGEDFGRRPRDE